VSGIEWLVEAFGCVASRLRDPDALGELFRDIVAEMGLNPLGEPTWHRFPAPGGVTGMWLLSESHLTIHSFPEFGSVCLNLFCCRERAPLDWHARLALRLGAKLVQVQEFRRAYRAHRPGVGESSEQ
jgi:S-adenosylmethionine decarboxylase